MFAGNYTMPPMITTMLLLATIVAADIDGQVFVSGRNEAVPFAKVALLHSQRPVDEQYTDGLGRFRFTALAPGRYTISVESNGYERATVEVDLVSSTDGGNAFVELRKSKAKSESGPAVMSLRAYAVPREAQKEFGRARDRMKRGEWTKAIGHLEKGLRAYDADAAAHNDLGNSYRSLGQLDRAEQSFKRAIELGDSLYFSLNLAEVYLAQKRFQEAEAVVAAAILKFPEEGDPYYGLANVYFVQERFQDAEAAALEADSRKHRIADVHLLLAKIYVRSGNSAAVVVQLQTYLKEAPDGPAKDKIRKALKLSNRGNEVVGNIRGN